MRRAVVFDLDGTLADTLDVVTAGYIDTIRELGGPVITRDELEAVWHLGPTSVVMQHFLEQPSPPAVARFLKRIRSNAHRLIPFDGIEPLLRDLRAAGTALGIVTNGIRASASAILDATGLAPFFDSVVCADEAPPKPASEGLRRVLAEVGAEPGDSAFVGDAWVDLDCAEAAAVRGIHATWTFGGTCAVTPVHTCVSSAAELRQLLRPFYIPRCRAHS